MYTQPSTDEYGYTASARVIIEEWEQANSTPVRMVNMRRGNVMPGDWTTTQAEQCHVPVEEARENGMTIVHYATSQGRAHQWGLGFYATLPESGMLAFYSGLAPRGNQEILDVIWMPADIRQGDSNWPNGRPTNLEERAGEIPVGEYGGRTIYDWLGLSRLGASGAVNDPVARAWCEAMSSMLDPEYAAAAQQRAQERAMAALDEYAHRAYDARVTELRDGIRARMLRITSYREAISTEERQLDQEEEILNAVFQQRGTDEQPSLRDDFAALVEHPRTQSVRFEGGAIRIVTTDDIRLYHPRNDQSRWLGRFDILLNLESLQVRINNLDTRRHGNADHPHIHDGQPCFGGHHDDFNALLRQGQIVTYFELLLQYIETFNIEDVYGGYAAYWFDMPDERPLETTTATA